MHALTRRLTPLALCLAIACSTIGCESQTPEPMDEDPGTQTEDIEARFGGFNSSDETAGFGDDYLLREGDRPVDDDMENDPDVDALAASDSVCAYAVRITWGYLERDSSHVNAAVSWDGSAVVDAGALLARRTILFEPLQGDHVVRPRPNRRTLEWESTTTRHFDGLQLLVLDPTGEDATTTLRIEMPLYTAELLASELDGLNRTIDVDDAGHQVRIQARKLVRDGEPAFCRHGWLAGEWGRLPNDDRPNDLPDGIRGRFRGHWTTSEGTAGGVLRGFYGVNPRGHRVLFGKLISENGRFEAYMRGTWGRAADTPGHGVFLARLYDGDRNPIGGTRGVWQRRDDGRGTFMGGWALLCPDDENGDVEIDEEIFEPSDGAGR